MSYVARVLGQSGISMDSVVDEMRFLTIEKIGPKQSFTPEGFLLIRDTPVARCGWQIYGPKEIPLHLYPDFAPPPDGVFRVKRDEDEVFAEETIASANGKPVVDEHPPDIVTPDTHAGVPGVMFDVRRGAGAEEDLMIADLIIYNKDLIAAIQDGKRELSCGYDVDYEELAPGKLAQKNIRINHVALVDSGRCGPRCSISDHSQTAEEKDPMATIKNAKRSSIVDAIRGVLKSSTYLAAKDREELEKALEKKIGDEIPEEVTERDEAASPNGHHIEVHTHMPATAEKDDDPPDGGMEERMSRVESAVHELAEMIKSLGGSGEAEEATSDDEVVVPAKAVEGEAILGQLELEAPVGAEAVDVRKAKDSRYPRRQLPGHRGHSRDHRPGDTPPDVRPEDAPRQELPGHLRPPANRAGPRPPEARHARHDRRDPGRAHARRKEDVVRQRPRPVQRRRCHEEGREQPHAPGGRHRGDPRPRPAGRQGHQEPHRLPEDAQRHLQPAEEVRLSAATKGVPET
jgi:hypothetical protein